MIQSIGTTDSAALTPRYALTIVLLSTIDCHAYSAFLKHYRNKGASLPGKSQDVIKFQEHPFLCETILPESCSIYDEIRALFQVILHYYLENMNIFKRHEFDNVMQCV